MKTLYETNQLILESEFEHVHLKDKSTQRILFEDDFYGEAQCGVIDPNTQWAIVGGEYLSIWTPKTIKRIEDDRLKWIIDARIKDDATIELLTDPWSEESAIWELNVNTFEFKKIREFHDYKEKVYTENVIW